MKTSSIFDDVDIKRRSPRRFTASTAVEIFDRDFIYPFEVDQVHFKMNNGTHKLPMPVSGSARDQQQQFIALIPTMGTIINMSDYYRDGATISIKDPEVARKVYKTILRHMEAHLNAMQNNRSYVPPQDNTLRELADFATAIYYKAVQGDDDLDNEKTPSSFFAKVAASRPYLSFSKDTVADKPTDVIPKSITRMDAIERYLSTMGM